MVQFKNGSVNIFGKRRNLWSGFNLLFFFIGVFGLFIWNRSESRSDIRHMDNKLDAYKRSYSCHSLRNEGFP